jgi:hypothetical protein
MEKDLSSKGRQRQRSSGLLKDLFVQSSPDRDLLLKNVACLRQRATFRWELQLLFAGGKGSLERPWFICFYKRFS